MVKLSRVFAGGCTCAGIIFLVTWPAAAQDARVGLDVGYQFVWGESEASPQGVSVAVSSALTDRFALVGEGGWSRDSTTPFGLSARTTTLQASGGVRWSIMPGHRLLPYAQVLAGGGRDRIAIAELGNDAEWNVFVQPGGGAAVRIGARESVFGQVDLREVFAREGSRTSQVRLLAGIRLTLR
jgi:hypothetical protein